MARHKEGVPADSSGSAKLAGQEREREVFGLADLLLRVSVNFFGAPALSMEDYPTYRQDIIVGVSFQVTAPVGQYDSTKLLNGSVILELIHPRTGPHLLRAGTPHLRIPPPRAFWAALDATYHTGGRATINGEQGPELESVRLGVTTALSLSRHQSIKLYGGTGVYNRTATNSGRLGSSGNTAGVEGCSDARRPPCCGIGLAGSWGGQRPTASGGRSCCLSSKAWDIQVKESNFRDDGVVYEKSGVKVIPWRQSHVPDGTSAYRLDKKERI